MSIPDYEFQARRAAKLLGSQLVRATLDKDTTLYGLVHFVQWRAASTDQFESQHWYEVRFEPLGKRFQNTWSSSSSSSDAQLNRLHFSVLERTAEHHEGATCVAKLGPIGHIRTEPKSVGLGTYLRDHLIDWVASIHPNASVARGSLSTVDGSVDNLERRKRFYVGGNFKIQVQDDGSGSFWADRLDGLRRCTKEGNVVELATEDLQLLLKCAPELATATLRAEHLRVGNKQLLDAMAKAQARSSWCKGITIALIAVLLIATWRGNLSLHLF